jgi:uncharacterized protein
MPTILPEQRHARRARQDRRLSSYSDGQLDPLLAHAVHGNVDEAPLGRSPPAELEIRDRRANRRNNSRRPAPPKAGWRACVDAFRAADAVVFGHSHLPLHESADGFQIFNPGSPTERRRAPRPSMGLLSCGQTGLVFAHVWL